MFPTTRRIPPVGSGVWRAGVALYGLFTLSTVLVCGGCGGDGGDGGDGGGGTPNLSGHHRVVADADLLKEPDMEVDEEDTLALDLSPVGGNGMSVRRVPYRIDEPTRLTWNMEDSLHAGDTAVLRDSTGRERMRITTGGAAVTAELEAGLYTLEIDEGQRATDPGAGDEEIFMHIVQETRNAAVAQSRFDFFHVLSVTFGSNCHSCDLSYADLSVVGSFSGRDFANTNFTGANLSGRDLSGALLSSSQFDGANLSDANLQNARLENARFFDANMARANLSYASGLIYADRADLRNATLARADFRWSEFIAANISSADLTGTNLFSARLTSTNFSRSTLNDTNLQRAFLYAANLTDAYVSANFKDALWLETATLTGANLYTSIWTDGRECAPRSIGECR